MLKIICASLALVGASAERYSAKAKSIAGKKAHYENRVVQYERQLKMMNQRVLSTLQSIAKVQHPAKKLAPLPKHLENHEGARQQYQKRQELVDQHNEANPPDVTHKIRKLENLAKTLDSMLHKSKESHDKEVAHRNKVKKQMGNRDVHGDDEHFDTMFDSLFDKTRSFDTKVVSKIRNAVHLLKKGALTGNEQAHTSLQKLVGDFESISGNFLV